MPVWANTTTYVSTPSASFQNDGFNPTLPLPYAFLNWILNKLDALTTARLPDGEFSYDAAPLQVVVACGPNVGGAQLATGATSADLTELWHDPAGAAHQKWYVRGSTSGAFGFYLHCPVFPLYRGPSAPANQVYELTGVDLGALPTPAAGTLLMEIVERDSSGTENVIWTRDLDAATGSGAGAWGDALIPASPVAVDPNSAVFVRFTGAGIVAANQYLPDEVNLTFNKAYVE